MAIQNQKLINQRRSMVASLVMQGKTTVSEIYEGVKDSGIVNPNNGKPYSKSIIVSDIKEVTEEKNKPQGTNNNTIKEIIGRYTYVKPIWGARVLLNTDKVQSDWAFWDSFRNGKAKGFEFASIYCKPITQILAAYILGEGLNAELISSANSTNKSADTTPLGSTSKIVDRSQQINKNKNFDTAMTPTNKIQNQKNIPSITNSTKIEGSIGNNNQGQPVKQFGPPNAVGANPNAPPPGLQPSHTIPSTAETNPLNYTNEVLHRFMQRNQGLFTRVITDLYALGDQYLIVNPDCTISVPSPETVTVDFASGEIDEPIRYVIRTKLEDSIVQDVYTKEKRVIKIHFFGTNKKDIDVEYENLLGEIPIIHLTCDKGNNEVYGRPIYEALITLFSRYDDLLLKALNGVQLLSNPMPAFTELDNIQETKDAMSTTEFYTDIDGTQQTRQVIRFDEQPAIFVGKGGKFGFVGPGTGFTGDVMTLLKQLMEMIMYHTRIPEFLWGAAVSSSKASVETQMPPFVRYVDMRRLQLEGIGSDELLQMSAKGGFLQLIDVWLKMYKLINPAIVVAPVALKWQTLSGEKDQQRLAWVQWADSTGKLSPETALGLSELVNDPAAEIIKAQINKESSSDFSQYDRMLKQAELDAAKEKSDPVDQTQQTPEVLLTGVTYDPNVLPSQLNDEYSLIGPAFIPQFP